MSLTTEPKPRGQRARLVRLLAAAGALLLVGTFAVLYGSGRVGKESAAACEASAARTARLAPLAHGEVAALAMTNRPLPFTDLGFTDKDGTTKTLADFRGRVVLLNLWATWCVPCRKEMPALDRLEAALGGPDFQVVAVNVDTAKLERARQFLADVGATALPFYADPAGKVLPALHQTAGLLGLPTSYLIDRNGCGLGTMAGPAEWASPEAQALITAAKS